MLQQFSWGRFLIAVVVLNLVWYVFVGVVFYRAELRAFLNGGNGGGSGRSVEGKPVIKSLGRSDQEIEREVDAALMGSSRLSEGVEVILYREIGGLIGKDP